MSTMWLLLIPILLTDIINPILFYAVLMTLKEKSPLKAGGILLASYFVFYFLTGVIFVLGMEVLYDVFTLSDTWDYVIEAIAAALLLYMAYQSYYGNEPHEVQKQEQRGSLQWMRFALQVHIVGLPVAVPYLAAADVILKADIGYSGALFALFIYNIGYILPFLLFLLTGAFLHATSPNFVKRSHQVMDFLSERVMPVLFVVIALVLVEDILSYFIGYREWSWLSVIRGADEVS